ncbi:MAG: phosphomannomutase/phosphoglucomutase [Verrucomicrobia bacterium]|nr:phosphomannomutase/phosphoglucomutase [Verrucomicrobiota bacterium]
MEKWLRLQNGSDVRGVAIEGVAGQPITLTDDIARSIGYAFAKWLTERTGRTNLTVAVGNDSRLSADAIKEAVFQGLEMGGCVVFDCGLASTPAMFMSTVFENYTYDGSIMLTASHLPFNRNGMKFFIAEGGLEKQDIKAILITAAEAEAGELESLKPSSATRVPLMDDYASHLVQVIREGTGKATPLDGLKIVVDAGNGAGGFFVDSVLNPLGADTAGSQFLDPDGAFPNHIPNPEDKDAMEAIIAAVTKNNADFGIIFDTDVDRAGAVDKNGKPINRNRFIALMSTIVLGEHPGSTIVTDSVTSSGLKWWIEDHLQGVHHRFQRGYRNVINEAVRLNEAGTESWLAMETSGHGALKENYFLDDGAYQIAKILIKIAQLKCAGEGTVDELIAALPEPAEAKEYRPLIKEDNFSAYADTVLEAFTAFVEQTEGWSLTPKNHEGVHVTCDANSGNGWALLRKSLHDPQMPLNIESDSQGGTALIAGKIRAFLLGFDGLDVPTMA